jgi:Recombinase
VLKENGYDGGARQRMKGKSGRCDGAKPFGTKPDELETLNRMKELRAGGNSFDRIAATLNAEGILTRSGGQWIGSTCCAILQREKRILNRLPQSTVDRIRKRG